MTALDRLLAEARRLPGAPAHDLPRALDGDARDAAALPPLELRRRVGALLAQLAAQVSDELPRAIERARTAWDQVDAVTLVDADTLADARRLRLAATAESDDAPARAEALAAALTLDAAVGLAALIERRLATLLRLGAGERLGELGAALQETAKAWA